MQKPLRRGFSLSVLLLGVSLSCYAAVSKSAALSVVVNGYIDLPDIHNVSFATITPSTIHTPQTISQSPYDITTDYDVNSGTPNVEVHASADYDNSTGAYMTNNPGAAPAEQNKLYYSVSYHACGAAGQDFNLVSYNTGSVFPMVNVPNSESTASSCAVSHGTLSITRLGTNTSDAYPMQGTYHATLTLTAQPIGT